jgi:hypothetical protein
VLFCADELMTPLLVCARRSSERLARWRLPVLVLGDHAELDRRRARSRLNAGAEGCSFDRPPPSMGQGRVEDPPRLAGQALSGPGIAVVDVGDDGVYQVGGDAAGAELVDGGQVDDRLA